MQYAVIFEKTHTGWSAYPPDLPGCGATGRTLDLCKRRTRWAIQAHIKGLREDGEQIPHPTTLVEWVDVEE
jgi:predicted RNase H-like HicB family nuclease